MKKTKIISPIYYWLIFSIVCSSESLSAQTLEPKIINQKGSPIYTERYNPNDTITLEDWHYGGVETSDGDFVFTTRIEQYDISVNGKREYPGLIKYDKYFNIKWHQF